MIQHVGPLGDPTIGEIVRDAEVDEGAVAAVVALADGNPGASMVLGALVRGGHSESLTQFDRAGLHGDAIWTAFTDVCGQDLELLASRLANDPGALAEAVKATGRV